MRRRALAVVAALVAIVALARERGPAADAPGGRPQPASARPSPVEEGLPRVDPASLRDVFRFADEASPAPGPRPADPVEARPAAAVASGGPRLVGLVRRGGLVRAAFAVDGEVVLAGPGETAGDVIVIAVEEEGVRVRREDGREQTLPLGD